LLFELRVPAQTVVAGFEGLMLSVNSRKPLVLRKGS
jgi:hypothetical protein